MSKVQVFAFVAALALVLTACGSGVGSFQVIDAWARPGLTDGNSAVFFVINNPGAADLLLSASSDVADAVEIHKTIMQDGTMQMVQQMNVPVPTGETIFKTGDLHVMLIGLKDDLNPGDSFTLTVNFEKFGEQVVNVTVREP